MKKENAPEKDGRKYESRLFPSRMLPGHTPDDIKKGLWLMLGITMIPFVMMGIFSKQPPEQTFNGEADLDSYTQALNQEKDSGVCKIATHLENSRKPHIETYGLVGRLGDCFAVAYKAYSENPKGYNVGFGLVDNNGIDIVAQGYCGLDNAKLRMCSVNQYRLKLE